MKRLVFATACFALLGCSTSPKTSDSLRVPADREELLTDTGVGEKIVFLMNLQTRSAFEYVAFTKSGIAVFDEPASMFQSNRGLMEGGRKLGLRTDETVCAVGFHPEHRKNEGFSIRSGQEFTLSMVRSGNGTAGSWGPPKGYSVFELDGKYLLKCAVLKDEKEGYSVSPTIKDYQREMSSLWKIEVGAFVVASVPANQAGKQYFSVEKSFTMSGNDGRVSVKNGEVVPVGEVFNSSKACYIKTKGEKLQVNAGEVMNVLRMYKEGNSRIFETEKIEIACTVHGIFINKSMDLDDVNPKLSGVLTLHGFEDKP